MTKFKQGDRVVPERFDGGLWTESMVELVNVPGEITDVDYHGHCKVHHHWWPSSALRPASPKWEPGQECRYQENTYTIYGVCEPYAWIKMKNYNCPFSVMLKDIRPIAPSPEKELKAELIKRLSNGFDMWKERITEVLLPIIMEWHNRHKEGEGR